MKVLKNLSNHVIQLYLGSSTVSIQANDTVDYSYIVIEDPSNPNYNLPLILSYINQNILTIVSEVPIARPPGIVYSEVIVNFSPALTQNIKVNASIQFTNLTSIDLTNASFVWTFTNTTGTTSINYLNSTTANSKDPLVSFLTAGSYTINLTATNIITNKIGTLTKTNLIVVTI